MACALRRPLVRAATILIAGLMHVPCDAAALAGLSRSAVAFGRVPQSHAGAAQPVFVTNLGDDALIVTALTLSGEDAADFRLAAGGTCNAPAALGPGQRCRIDVVALPQWARTRDISAQLTVESSDGTAEVRLSATADATLLTALVASAPAFVDFPPQPVSVPSAQQSLIIANVTTLPLALGRPALLGGDATDFAATTDCPLDDALAPGRNCAITLTFTPRGAGPRATELAVELAQDGYTGFHRWSVTGTGGE